MGRGLPDPPPQAPPEKPAEPYKPISLNGPPVPAVQSCKWEGAERYSSLSRPDLGINHVIICGSFRPT